jgi:type III restriction enzyme
MELKAYQQAVVSDLAQYLSLLSEYTDPAVAYRQYWSRRGVLPGTGSLPDYQEAIESVPHVCLKVPTAGGKTFIACNSLRPIFESVPSHDSNLVVWLVPSKAILEQTLRNLRDVDHPYRKRLNAHFTGRIEIFDKDEVLQGAGFSPDSLETQLNVVIMSFDSFRATNKEGRKVYQENENLTPFSPHVSQEAEDLSLVSVLSSLQPVVVVDESHNAQTTLSFEMLANLTPRFILELTATPRDTSNVISVVNAGALKKEHMVKLPVVVYNNGDATEVLQNAISLRGHLEQMADEQQQNGGPYLRPIVLVQAEPKNASDSETFEKLKQKLVDAGIPEDQIAIKTAKTDEIAGIDLLSPDCPIRYIVTVNALKEGWDCSFAYILATVSNRTSRIDVEQILGRILRQPYARQQANNLLNLSYVFTSSNAFHVTLEEIVRGLNRAGFSRQDYRVAEEIGPEGVVADQLEMDSEQSETPAAADEEDPVETIKAVSIAGSGTDGGSDNRPSEKLYEITKAAIEQENRYEEAAETPTDPIGGFTPTDTQSFGKSGYGIRNKYRELVQQLALPQFFYKIPGSLVFGDEATETLLDRVNLLKGFKLADKNTQINFSLTATRAYAIDIDESDGMASPEYRKIKTDDHFYQQFVEYLRRLPVDDLKREVASRIMHVYKRKDFLNDKDLMVYVQRVLENLTSDQLQDLKQRPADYVRKIVEKIDSLIRDYAQESFRDLLTTGEVFLKPNWRFPERIAPTQTLDGIPNSLYEKEGTLNNFEHRVINEVANLDNVYFWHRNIERQEFKINAFINHYPDFIVVTKNDRVITLETKGDDRDNSDSANKVRLGNDWAARSGDQYDYMMVFDNNAIEGAWALDKFVDVIRRM